MKEEIEIRVSKLLASMKEQSIDAVMLATEEHSTKNVRYFSNFSGSAGYVLIARDRQIIFTDSRYWEQTQAQSPLTFEKIKESNARSFVARYFQGYQRVGFESKAVTVDFFDALKTDLPPETEWVPVDGLISSIRCSKSDTEKKKVVEANKIAIAAFREVIGELREGMTEKEVATTLEFRMMKLGAEDKAFGTIVASGWRGALPHGVASEKKIEKGELIVFDFGCYLDGYCSDITRTIAFGKPSEEMISVYHIVKEAQNRSERAAKAGMSGKDIDTIAREIISDKGYGEYFGHGLGHGIGLDVHEEPRVSQANQNPLPAGSIVTIEPGVYLPNRFGVRIENDVFLGEEATEVLTNFPTDFIIV